MLTVRIQEKNYSESIMVLKLKDGPVQSGNKLFTSLDRKIRKETGMGLA